MNRAIKLSVHPQPQPCCTLFRKILAVTTQSAVFTIIALQGSAALRAQASAQAAAAEVKPDLSAYVSRDLDHMEQSVVRSTLQNMPLGMQQEIAAKPADSVHIAIVEGGTGNIHNSRPEDAGSFELQPDAGMPGDENPFAAAKSVGTDPGVYGGSGPYRRVYTKPLPKLAQSTPTDGADVAHQHFYVAGGAVSIACKMGSFASGDVGYSYMGGWSGSWSSLSGTDAEASAVDAGLQYSPAKNNYAMILAISKVGIITVGNYKYAVAPPRIECTNQAKVADIHFSVLGALQPQSFAPSCYVYNSAKGDNEFIGFPNKDCSTYALSLSVTSDQFTGHIGKTQTYYLIWYSPSYSRGGWAELMNYTAKLYNGQKNVSGYVPRVPCENCAFKWMTSIAQSKENLHDKSWYAAGWYAHRVGEWEDGSISYGIPAATLYCTEYPLWEASYPSAHAQDCKNSPLGLKGAQQSVSVTNFSSQKEIDLIDLKY